MEARDTIHESTLSTFSQDSHVRAQAPRYSASTFQDSPTSSRAESPFGGLSPHSLATSTVVTVDVSPEPKPIDTPRRPSILTRLRSSISSISGVSPQSTKWPSVHPSDFRMAPEQPERHFIDSIGMVIPGVSNRSRCAHPLAHFITNWRLCEPIEYTTALADHGVTYSDYLRLTTSLANFLDELPNEVKRRASSVIPRWRLVRKKTVPDNIVNNQGDVKARPLLSRHNSSMNSSHQHHIVEQQALSLNGLLEDISWNWQRRGLPVMVCISSFSLFAPNRISESTVQILHIPLQPPTPPKNSTESRTVPCLSFVNPFVATNMEERSVAIPCHKLNRRSISPPLLLADGGYLHHDQHYHRHPHQQFHFRDRSKPWPLWPNAIPSRKRAMMNGVVDRYGVDPYFRAWVRASINSRTKCASYAKYMIEKEDNPFINTRLEYVTPPSRAALLWGLFNMGPKKWRNQKQYPTTTNRGIYEHNRRLECRKTVEHGSRLRITRFGFRHPIYPSHTPEMEELGLTRETYRAVIGHIEKIRWDYKSNVRDCLPPFLASWDKIRHRRTEDALTKVSEYIRHLNASDRRVVWTIEKIPGVYDRGLGRDTRDWEISVWNGEDPLELLIQLENWGIIEKRLNIDDDG